MEQPLVGGVLEATLAPQSVLALSEDALRVARHEQHVVNVIVKFIELQRCEAAEVLEAFLKINVC